MADVQTATVTRCVMEHEGGFDLHTDAQPTLTDRQGRDFEFELLVTCFHNTRYEIEMQFDRAILTFSLFRPMRPEVRVAHGQRAYQLTDPLRQDSPGGVVRCEPRLPDRFPERAGNTDAQLHQRLRHARHRPHHGATLRAWHAAGGPSFARAGNVLAGTGRTG